jgi:TM2 domain-containing membrane protein YozV
VSSIGIDHVAPTREKPFTTAANSLLAARVFWHADNMTEPQFGGYESGAAPPPFQPPPFQPPPGYPPPYPPPPPGPGYADPSAPYGRHPTTGEPYSDKSKVVAGLLQLLGLFGIVGIGRIYLGQTGLGIAQLVVGLVTCGLGAVVWGIIDAIMILTDKVRDAQGRPLRDGT